METRPGAHNNDGWRANVDGAACAHGNGELLVYTRGADILHVYGAPYTTASQLALTWALDTAPSEQSAALTYASRRRPGSSVWEHRMLAGNQIIGVASMLVDAEAPVFLCHLQLSAALRCALTVPPGATLVTPAPTAPPVAPADSRDAAVDEASFLALSPDTARALFYPVGVSSYLSFACWGASVRQIAAPGERTSAGEDVSLICGPGEVTLALAGSVVYPEALAALAEAKRLGFAECARRRQTIDRRLFSRLRIPAGESPISGAAVHDASATADAALRARIVARVEGVAQLIIAQQSSDGGVMAGTPYPLAYLRDQFGVCRGLLALGLHDEVRRNLDFRLRKWRHFGTLANAESMGHDRIRHRHENDDVEQTAYTILQALDYAEATEDWEALTRLAPLLEWCVEAQLPHLRDGMLPFNGDETYVAGGFLPRSALNDGSFEATLLFLDSLARLVPVARRLGLIGEAQLRRYIELRLAAEPALRHYFWRAGRFVTNAPERATMPGMPAFRHGVCEACGAEGFGWTQRTPDGRYVCPRCLGRLGSPVCVDAQSQTAQAASERRPLEAQSASLLPLFIHSQTLTQAELQAGVERALAAFEQLGYLPTLSDADDVLASQWAAGFVGYDPALLLYGLAELRHPAAPRLTEYVVGLADSADGWAEYYTRVGEPAGTRCRPWESGVAIAALLRFLETAPREG